MFWYPISKGKVKSVDANSKQEAKKILKAIGIKKPIIFTEEEKNEYIEEHRPKTSQEIWASLDATAQSIANIFYLKRSSIMEVDVKDLGLDKDTDKPYYVRSSWDSGHNGGFCTLEEAKDTIIESVTADHEDWFDVEVIDTETLEAVDYETKVSVDVYFRGDKV